MSRIEKQKETNNRAFLNPKVGDYWQEMFCPYFIVLEVIDSNTFWVCDERKPVDENNWTWDLEKSKMVDKLYFNRVKYSPTSEGFVADVIEYGTTNPFISKWEEIKKEKFHDVDSLKIQQLRDKIKSLEQNRKEWINRYVDLIIDSLLEKTVSNQLTYLEIIKEENPELIARLKKVLNYD